MIRKLILVCIVFVLSACADPDRLVYSNGFTFANYDYMVISKPDGEGTSTNLFGFDVEFGNLMSRYNMKVIGNKELDSFSPEQKAQTLIARMAMNAGRKKILLSVSFDSAVTGKTVSSITSNISGDIYKPKDRDAAFEAVTNAITSALQRDKNLKITDVKANQ